MFCNGKACGKAVPQRTWKEACVLTDLDDLRREIRRQNGSNVHWLQLPEFGQVVQEREKLRGKLADYKQK